MLPDKKMTIEIKSLNGKQLDSNIRIPSLYREKELDIRQLISSVLERGKVECSFYYEMNGKAEAGSINEPVVKGYYEQLSRISRELGLEASRDLLGMALQLPDTVRSDRPGLEETEWLALRNTLIEAMEQLNDFRIQEGAAMAVDLVERIRSIREKLAAISPFEEERIGRIRERIGQHLTEFIQPEQADENRFEQELIYYLEKLDISEEKVRLENHCSYFLQTMEEEGPVGKKLGFISQEIGREINTLGSKAGHPEIQRLVVEMKDELERIKEQILNVL